MQDTIREVKNNMMRKYIFFTLMSLFLAASVMPVLAQSKNDRWHIRQGNRQFRQGRVDEAATQYRMALSKDSLNPQAIYNMGRATMQKAIVLFSKEESQYSTLPNNIKTQVDSLFQQAGAWFMNAEKLETSPIRKAMSWHNVGWIYQKQEKLPNAIEAYKEALRNNPNDEETRYNLALCQWRLKHEKNEDQNQEDQNQQEGNVSFFVKDITNHEPLVNAEIIVTLTDLNDKQTRSQTTTNADGVASFVMGDSVKYKQIIFKASKNNFIDSTLVANVNNMTAKDYNNQPENARTLWMRPEPNVDYFMVVDSISGKPLPNVTNMITISGADGDAVTAQENSNSGGRFPVKAMKGDRLTIASKLKNYNDKNTVIPSYDKPVIIKMVSTNDQNQNDKQDKDKDKNQDQNKDQNKDKNNDQNQQNGQNQTQPQPQQGMSEQNMQRMLDAVNRKEQETQAKLEKNKRASRSRALDKNW